MRLEMDDRKLTNVVAKTQEYVDMSQTEIENFIDGGDEGWDCGDEEQQKWLDSASADEIANWVIAGN